MGFFRYLSHRLLSIILIIGGVFIGMSSFYFFGAAMVMGKVAFFAGIALLLVSVIMVISGSYFMKTDTHRHHGHYRNRHHHHHRQYRGRGTLKKFIIGGIIVFALIYIINNYEGDISTFTDASSFINRFQDSSEDDGIRTAAKTQVFCEEKCGKPSSVSYAKDRSYFQCLCENVVFDGDRVTKGIGGPEFTKYDNTVLNQIKNIAKVNEIEAHMRKAYEMEGELNG